MAVAVKWKTSYERRENGEEKILVFFLSSTSTQLIYEATLRVLFSFRLFFPCSFILTIRQWRRRGPDVGRTCLYELRGRWRRIQSSGFVRLFIRRSSVAFSQHGHRAQRAETTRVDWSDQYAATKRATTVSRGPLLQSPREKKSSDRPGEPW